MERKPARSVVEFFLLMVTFLFVAIVGAGIITMILAFLEPAFLPVISKVMLEHWFTLKKTIVYTWNYLILAGIMVLVLWALSVVFRRESNTIQWREK